MKKPIAYLAAPYSHEDPAVMGARFHAINKQAAKLMSEGYIVLSPISQGRPIALDAEPPLPHTWEFWREQCLGMLALCDILFVYQLPGWNDSTGVRAEIEYTQQHGIPVQYIGDGFSIN